MTKHNYDSAIELADRLCGTLNTAGWQDILRLANTKKAHYTDKALTEKDINAIYYAQAYVQAIDDFISEINALLNVGDEARKMKKK